ncbi:hypothetical protein J6590_067441 [Homalodisca vitripennis]|nr:hypothetical protein J6590_067441 [Homalodisca vitripennis]
MEPQSNDTECNVWEKPVEASSRPFFTVGEAQITLILQKNGNADHLGTDIAKAPSNPEEFRSTNHPYTTKEWQRRPPRE